MMQRILHQKVWVVLFAAGCLVLCAGFIFRENNPYPQGYFSMPLDRKVLLSGTFGELRSNHFHAGLDIKSKDGSVGEPLIACAPGFISRISVQASGYGNVIYMDHPNGYTSVCGHMDRFTPQVQGYVEAMQYLQERFAVDLYPKPDQFVFAKGDVIGYLGNTGSSSGPHVHFEIRKTADQLPINPLLFGLPVEDDANPGMRALRVYYLDQDLHHIKAKEYPLTSIGPAKYALRDTLIENAAYVGFGLKVYDQMTGASNQNGIYELGIAVDNMSQYHFELKSIPFSLTRYLNAHIDYAARRYSGSFFHRCFRLPGNALEIYEEDHEKGIIQIYENVPRKVQITASDFGNNTSTLEFYIQRGVPEDPIPARNYDHAIDYLQSAQINTPECMISFEPHTFYQNVKLHYIKSENVVRGCYTPAHEILPAEIPVHRYYDMTLHAGSLPERLRDKAFIGRIEDNGKITNCGGTCIGEYVYSRVRSLGSFAVSVDTIPPDVIPITFRENMRNLSKMVFRIGDNQPTEGQARGLSFDARVDNKWILMEYDAKSARLTHTFDERILEGPHELVLKVTDDRGNVTTFNRNFTR